MSDKPVSPACERNREPILAVLREHFDDRRRVLEIGSGSGQHAVHFAAAMPWLLWQCTDRAVALPGIGMWLEEAALANTPPPLELDVAAWPWFQTPFVRSGSGSAQRSAPTPALPRKREREQGSTRENQQAFDVAFSANTLHIMSWGEVEALFDGLDAVLTDDAVVAVYGPFNYGGTYSSDSNREFDAWLKARDLRSGIRDFEAVDGLARAIGLRLIEDVAMPANNRCLMWRREGSNKPQGNT